MDGTKELFSLSEYIIAPKHTTHTGGKGEYLHDWYAYLEGYSSEFVKSIIRTYLPYAENILEPFAGVGTTPITLSVMGISCSYSEVNPAMRKVIDTKIAVSNLPKKKKKTLALEIEALADNLSKILVRSQPDPQLKITYSAAFKSSKFFTADVFELVLKGRTTVDELSKSNPLLARALEVAIMAVLIKCSLLKRAGDVRFKTAKELSKGLPDFLDSVKNQLIIMAKDCIRCPDASGHANLVCSNAKDMSKITPLNADGVITSPPYLNGTNYFRNTKLELWFTRDLTTSKCLRRYRDAVVTSGINDVTKDKGGIVHPCVRPYYDALSADCYDSRIPKMVCGYFQEMSEVMKGLAKHTTSGAKICIDIGDSIYNGIHIPTHDLLGEIANDHGLELEDFVTLRARKSKNGANLSQTLLVFNNTKISSQNSINSKSVSQTMPSEYMRKWKLFKETFPHTKHPYSKRNWGSGLHSVCSYQGKMKPSLAYHLVKVFSSEGDTVLDPFSGSGTIPFEASMNGRIGLGMDIGLLATSVTNAKLMKHDEQGSHSIVQNLRDYIENNEPSKTTIRDTVEIRYNKTIPEYFHKDTLREILLARDFFIKNHKPECGNWSLVLSCLLHILHGNRPYALSRTSHPITPYAPKGEYIKKSLIDHLVKKIDKSLNTDRGELYQEGHCYKADILEPWPENIQAVDTIITSPPFFDSTKFYMTNWMRYWFCGWSKKDFEDQPKSFIEVMQKKSFDAYEFIFEQCHNRLKKGGLVVFHLGHSDKCDMAEALTPIAKKFFEITDCFTESVEHCETHGISDNGSVKGHQYLVMKKI